MLSWAGLIVNGSVAFLLPVTLVILAHHNLRRYGSSASKESGLTRKALDELNRSNHDARSKINRQHFYFYFKVIDYPAQYLKKQIY